MNILAGFIVGFLGSFHCIGMCGPIALALPTGASFNRQTIIRRFLYNLGRVFTYSLMGGLFGLLGERVKLFGFQQALSIIIGSVILAQLFFPGKLKGKLFSTKIYMIYNKNIKSKFILLLKKDTAYSFFAIGVLNGFLPCGFVYIALAGAVSLGSALDGALFMACFGLGTAPVMFAATLAGNFINLSLRKKIMRLMPVFVFIFAAIFILRGLNLGIPYLSPKLFQSTTQSTEVDCCH
jgi:uncharacterized protein